MKAKLIILSVMLTLIIISGCGKKDNEKFAGVYSVSDDWKSSKTIIGSGNLEYDMTVVPDGDDGVLLMNVNKTFNSVKATVEGESITVGSQIIQSVSGTKYKINGYSGKLKDNKLDLKFVYSDALYGDAVGEVECNISGTKPKSSKD